jgi:hypothetical protein
LQGRLEASWPCSGISAGAVSAAGSVRVPAPASATPGAISAKGLAALGGEIHAISNTILACGASVAGESQKVDRPPPPPPRTACAIGAAGAAFHTTAVADRPADERAIGEIGVGAARDRDIVWPASPFGGRPDFRCQKAMPASGKWT